MTQGGLGTGASSGVQFAVAKFRPPVLPATLVPRPTLLERLTAGAGDRLTVVVGSAGAGKSVLLSSWAAARPARLTSWLSCDPADADPARFWAGFIEAPRVLSPDFGDEAGELLAMDRGMSADVTASIANAAARLPPGSAIIVDDFHYASASAGPYMADLVDRWPAETAQLVLSSRSDPPLRLHRLRMSGQLCELRDPALAFSPAESEDLLAKFGVQIAAADLARLQERSEGWAAALQMVALSLRGTTDPARVARALDIHRHMIAEYFISDVLDQQPPDVVRFMLDTSILSNVTAAACAAVTGRDDAAALLRGIDTGNLFLVPLDEERTMFRYHRLVRQVLRAELKARDRGREQELHERAAAWLESTGDTWRATRHFVEARDFDRALAIMQSRSVAEIMQDPGMPETIDLSMLPPSLLAGSTDRLLAVATDLLMRGDLARCDEYLDVLEQSQRSKPLEPRLAARFTAIRACALAAGGQLSEAAGEVRRMRAIQQQGHFTDEWNATMPLVMLHVNTALEDLKAVEREAELALAMPSVAEPVKRVMVPGARALAWFEAGHLRDAAEAAGSAAAEAERLGFERHYLAVDYLGTLVGLALEQRDLDTAERLAEQHLRIAERRRPGAEFLALLDRARIWAARGYVSEALTTVEAARGALSGTRSVLLTRADELAALLRLSLGDRQSPAALVTRLPAADRALLRAKIALAGGDHRAAQEQLQSPSLASMTPRRALMQQLLLAATAIERGDPMAGSVLGGALHTARQEGYVNTVVTAAPQVASYLIEHSTQLRQDPFTRQLIGAALDTHASQPAAGVADGTPAGTLTPAELRVLRLLPTNTYLEMASTLYVSRNTVKTHLRSIYQKLCVTTRAEAIERAAELGLL
ncbi:MAG TPA: LuxR C-terminal-related transcriptional regulator [Streptosporangiaceae bacterium]